MTKLTRACNSKQWSSLALAILFVFPMAGLAGTVVVTPGSLAGYTYFPPAAAAGGGSGGSSGGEQDSLQRCLWRPAYADQAVTVADDFGYGKDIKFYYRIAGGNGGPGQNGGGGGSSVIQKNGVNVVVADGGNGGQVAAEKSGVLTIKKGDVLRFMTGGGGGAGYWAGTKSIGGGGGAGFMGGGGGASHEGPYIASSPTAAGRGGGATPGAGGYGIGMWSGTAGGYIAGGVATYLYGNSAPNGGANPGGAWMYFSDWNYGTPYYSPPGMRFPAGVNQGGPMGDVNSYSVLGGSGGGLGRGGGMVFNLNGNRGTYIDQDLSVIIALCSYNCNHYYAGAYFIRYPAHTEEMRLTRGIYLTGNQYGMEMPSGGSLSGQIIAMYQAPTCGILQ